MATKLVGQDGSPVKYQGQDVYSCDYAGVVKGVDMEKRQMIMTGTDETRDRDGDIIRLSGWKLDNYKKNPVFLWAHNYGSVPIARSDKVTKKKEPARMDFHLQFPTKGIYPFADMILELYEGRFINTSSVGFIPSKWEPIPEDEKGSGPDNPYGRVYISQELLELSGCAVPSNPNALQNALKGKNFGFKQDDLLKYLTGGTLIPRPENEDDVLAELDKSETEIVDETVVQVQVLSDLFESITASYDSEGASVSGTFILPSTEEVILSSEEIVDVAPDNKDNRQDDPAVEDPEDTPEEMGMEELNKKLDLLLSSVASIDQTLQSLVESSKGIQTSLTKVNGDGQRKPNTEVDPSSVVLRNAFRQGKVKVTPEPTSGMNRGGYKPESVQELRQAMADLAKALKFVNL
jgi:hypothetical protein